MQNHVNYIPNMIDYGLEKSKRLDEFYRYYGKKRAVHQHMQLAMLEKPAREGFLNLCEVGPYLGYATGLFLALGFKVKTIDFYNDVFGNLKTEHLEKNAEDIVPEDLKGSDIIVCCETLEHLDWDVSVRQMKVFYESGAEYLLISVPCKSWYFNLDLVATLTGASAKLSVKIPQLFRKFIRQPDSGHKWELGYRGYPPSKLRKALHHIGWNIKDTRHEVKNRSIFLLCQRFE